MIKTKSTVGRVGVFAFSVFSIFIFVSSFAQARVCDKEILCDQQDHWFFSFNTFELKEGDDKAYEHYKGSYSANHEQDTQVSVESVNGPKSERVELIILNSNAIISKGIDSVPALLEMEHVFLSVKLVAALLSYKFPNGPEAIEQHSEFEITGNDAIGVAVLGGQGKFAPPWKLSGVADKDASGRVIYRLHFSSCPKSETVNKDPEATDNFDLNLSGIFENSPTPLFDERMRLNGWLMANKKIHRGKGLAPTLVELRAKLKNEQERDN